MFNNISKDKKFIVVLLTLAVLNMFFIFSFSNSRLAGSDSYTYTAAMEHLLDRPTNSFFQTMSLEQQDRQIKTRLLTSPLLILSSMVPGVLADDFIFGMLFVNSIFYILLIIVFYFFARNVYNSSTVAFLSTLLVMFGYVMCDSGVNAIADIGGWFFLVLTNLLALKYYQNDNKKYFYLAIASSVVGVFFKEFGALGMISLGMLILISGKTLKAKAIEIIKAAILFLIIPLIYHLYFFFHFDYYYFSWYKYAADVYIFIPDHSNHYSLELMIKVLGWLYLAGWPLFLYGAWLEWKEKNVARLKILFALLPASLMFLFWPTLVQRIAFIFVFWLALISGYALSKMNKYLVTLYLVFYIIIAYSTPALRDIINLF